MIVLMYCWVSSTTMIPRIGEEKDLHHECVEKILRRRRTVDCADPLLGNNHQKDF